jgi:hypothetical protein
MTFGLLLSDFFKVAAFQVKFLLGIMYSQTPQKIINAVVQRKWSLKRVLICTNQNTANPLIHTAYYVSVLLVTKNVNIK